jgi:hypothetical protein
MYDFNDYSPKEDAIITSPNRPTDGILSRQLGRSLQSIRDRRFRIKDSRKQNEGTRRWKKKNPDKKLEQSYKNYGKSARIAFRSGVGWTVWEVDEVMEHKETDRKLGRKFGRSAQAIQSMRNSINAGRI